MRKNFQNAGRAVKKLHSLKTSFQLLGRPRGWVMSDRASLICSSVCLSAAGSGADCLRFFSAPNSLEKIDMAGDCMGDVVG